MKNHVEILKDSFIDYAGKSHQFVIVAVSDDMSESGVLVGKLNTDGFSVEDTLKKGIHIGVSICNPGDKYSEKAGVMKALGRAQNAPVALYATKRGYINSTVVKAFLQQEAEYLKKNPDLYIPGYNDSKERYLRNKSMEEKEKNFSEVEKIIVGNIKKDPTYLDNVNEYLTWFNNQRKGNKCKKHLK